MSYTNYYPLSKMFHGSLSSIMGTRLDVLLIGKEEDAAASIWTEIEQEVIRLDKMLNRFDKSSTLSNINMNAYDHPVKVNDEIWNILQDCRKYYSLTKGYFDVTLCNFAAILFNEENRSISFSSDSLYIDLGGYAKGYALAKLKEILTQNGITCALVNFGNSSILTIGSHPQGNFWPIGLENPYTNQSIDEIHLCNQSLSVSGNMPSHPKHIINPFTNDYIINKKMVSVVSTNPIDAEVLTTTFMIIEDTNIIDNIAENFDINKKQIYSL